MAISIKEPKEPRALLFNGLAGVKLIGVCAHMCVNLHVMLQSRCVRVCVCVCGRAHFQVFCLTDVDLIENSCCLC